MKSYTPIKLVVSLLVVLVWGCDRHKECTSMSIASVQGVSAPDSALVNQAVNFQVYYPIINGCGKFSAFEEEANGLTRTIKARVAYTGCVCTEIYSIAGSAYSFTPASPGTYILKFVQDSGKYLVDTLVVR